jgi:hypothetical protein
VPCHAPFRTAPPSLPPTVACASQVCDGGCWRAAWGAAGALEARVLQRWLRPGLRRRTGCKHRSGASLRTTCRDTPRGAVPHPLPRRAPTHPPSVACVCLRRRALCCWRRCLSALLASHTPVCIHGVWWATHTHRRGSSGRRANTPRVCNSLGGLGGVAAGRSETPQLPPPDRKLPRTGFSRAGKHATSGTQWPPPGDALHVGCNALPGTLLTMR